MPDLLSDVYFGMHIHLYSGVCVCGRYTAPSYKQTEDTGSEPELYAAS